MNAIEGTRPPADHHDDEASPGYPIRSVDNTLQILLMLRDRPTLRVSEISAELGVARSTAHRLLSALVHRGFVARNLETRRYHAGARLWELGRATVESLDGSSARRCLEGLSAESGETCHLVTLEGAHTRFVIGRAGRLRNQVGNHEGVRLPAHATSGGKMLLAHLSLQTVANLYPRPPMRLTNRTIPSVSALNDELAVVRRRGFAANLRESEEELAALAVGVWGPGRTPVAALAVALPAARLSLKDAHALRRAADRLSTALGGRGPGTVGGRAPVAV